MITPVKAKLNALLAKLQPLLQYASQADCDEALSSVLVFATAALAEKRHREELRPINDAMLWSLVSLLAPREEFVATDRR